jgi:demethylmenaquinone methyltransferase/2-methoxy-6-polyprenyl-1,4-benzoquinol methylase
LSERFRLKAREWLDVPERKRTYNERHFAEAASRYDVATRAMSLGRDAAWKRILVGSLPSIPYPVCVDLACGTGDVAFLLAGRYPGGVVTGVDLSAPMLAIARERNRFTNVRFEQGDMCGLPLPDRSVDVVTGSYALRNAPDLRKAIAEVHRVLSPGGVAAFLEFSNPERFPLRQLQYLLLRSWCGFWGLLLHGTPEIHGYVAESLRVFPARDRLREIFREQGLGMCADRRFFLGITGLLILRKGEHPAPAGV